jgi:steroid delta-isomerase-like uncharacterized protein
MDEGAETVSLDTNKRLARRVVEDVWNRGNRAAVEELYAADVVNLGLPPGRAALLDGLAATRAAFPDRQWAVEAVVAEGDTVVVRWTATGTHAGELAGIPATGRRVRVAGVTIFRVAGGVVREWWRVADDLGMLQQLGALPSALGGEQPEPG